MKHTPGPWQIEQWDIPSGGYGFRVVANEWPIAGINDYDKNPETQKANAELIASAPDLLIELTRLKELNREMYNAIDYYMTLMDRSNPGGAPEWEWEKADEMMREAFTKAGEES